LNEEEMHLLKHGLNYSTENNNIDLRRQTYSINRTNNTDSRRKNKKKYTSHYGNKQIKVNHQINQRKKNRYRAKKEDLYKCIIEEIVRQVGYLPELYEDERNETY
jgi:hypothetical protein